MPKVSVLMTAYNGEKYIGEAIESILSQTFTDFEFIIINDGSIDNTAKIIKEYAKKDKRILFVDNKKNMGRVAVLNQGLDICVGEYIALMDSDDVSLPERFAKQVEYMDANPDIGVLGTSYHQFGQEELDVICKKNPNFMDMIQRCPIANPSAMIKHSVLNQHNLRYRPQYLHAEDYDMWARMIRVTKLANLPEILLNYRWHGKNVSVVHDNIQHKNTECIRQELLEFLTDIPKLQKQLMKIVHNTSFYNPMFLNNHMKKHHPIKYRRLKQTI